MLYPVLILSADPGHRETLGSITPRCGFRPVGCGTLSIARYLLSRQRFTAILYEVPDNENFRSATSLAKGEVGIREPKPIPTLKQFCTDRVEPWAKSQFETRVSQTGLGIVPAFEPSPAISHWLTPNSTQSQVNWHRPSRPTAEPENADRHANNSLRVLRRILNLAVEWGVIAATPRIKVLSGERRRERVITPEDEARHLAAAPEPLATIAILLADTGTRLLKNAPAWAGRT